MKKKRFKLKLSTTSTTNIPDAEALFRDLKNRAPHIQHLWSHQADIIRAYHQNVKKDDIALELPTGTGKTLVGLLIAEWRRLALGERVVYLCPTRQLARQANSRASEYGIKTHVLVGKQSEYIPGHFADYASTNAIAITTYSGLFNTNPRINDPETIILDDAHAGENYIAKLWSISISRFKDRNLYDQIVALYSQDLPGYLVPILQDDNIQPIQKQSVDLLPGPKYVQKIQSLTDLLDTYTTDEDTDVIYPWQLIRGKLNSCCVLFSWSEILIRPIVPPTLTHSPFASAKQRVYMSATLGAGGELERITGVPTIHRIPVPSGWDRQSNGRRLFVFPDRSFTTNDYLPWLAEFISSRERSLVLTPHGFALGEFENFINNYGVTHTILKSQDIEASLTTFTNKSNAILALTNRYDGIDLPGDACRALIIYGLPASVNLYERFLWAKLGLTTVLNDRILTRITQAVGRCTRNSTDYAVVVMIGEDLFDLCIKRENRAELHPELRAEMDFGLDNSETDDIDELSALISLFINKEPDWNLAEADITKRRDESEKVIQSYVEVLRDVVNLEVKYQYDLWKEDYEGALMKATTIVDKLSGDEVSGYRALWHYFAGCAAYQLSTIKNQDEMLQTAANRFHRASQAVRSISWFVRLAHELDSQESAKAEDVLYLNVLGIEAINNYLTSLGTVGKKFDKTVNEFGKLITSSEADKFDKGLTELGKMLGFNAERPDGQGVPDSVWSLGSDYVLLFECKSQEKPSEGISISTCGQAQRHQNWYTSNYPSMQKAEISTIVISPREFLDKDAVPHAEGLFYLHTDEIRKLFREIENCLRVIRSKSTDLDMEHKLELIRKELSNKNLTPTELVTQLTARRLSDIEQR